MATAVTPAGARGLVLRGVHPNPAGERAELRFALGEPELTAAAEARRDDLGRQQQGADRSAEVIETMLQSFTGIAEQAVRDLFERYDRPLRQLVIALQDEATAVIDL